MKRFNQLQAYRVCSSYRLSITKKKNLWHDEAESRARLISFQQICVRQYLFRINTNFRFPATEFCYIS